PIVVGVGDDEAASGVDCQADRTVEPRLRRGAIEVPGRETAGDGRDGALWSDSTDGVVTRVRDVKYAVPGHGNSRRCAEPRRRARAIGISKPAARNRGHASIRTDSPEALRVTCVRDIDGAVWCSGEAERIREAGAEGGAVNCRGAAVPGKDRDSRDPS